MTCPFIVKHLRNGGNNMNANKAFVDSITVKPEERVLGTGDFIWLWFGMTAQMGVFLLGASFVGRISYVQAMLAILLANLVVAGVLVLNGDVGVKYGLKFSVYLQAPFGYLGSHIPTFMRSLTGIFWFGIQTYYGALAIDVATEYLWGYSNWFLWYIVFAVMQIAITAGGITWIKYLENAAAPALGLLSVWLIYILLTKNSFNDILTAKLTNPMHFWAVVTANLSYWVTVAVNISDFTRYTKVENPMDSFAKRNKISMIGQIPGITIGMIIFVSVGMIGGFYTGYGNPIDIISHTIGGNFMLLGLIIILLAQLSTNVAANLYAPGHILSNMFSKLNYSKAVIIAGTIGMFSFPWLLLEHFLTYLPLVGAFLSPLPGIMIVDYYFIRKTELNLEDFDRASGKFEYSKGFNPAALIAYVISGVVGIIFLEYSWLFSLPVASISYYLLMKLWIEKK